MQTLTPPNHSKEINKKNNGYIIKNLTKNEIDTRALKRKREKNDEIGRFKNTN